MPRQQAITPEPGGAPAGTAPERSSRLGLLLAIGAPLLGILAYTAWQVHAGFNMADEAFLWYGAQRTAGGDLPFRDFQSYDPGRYLWTALWMKLAGNDGLVVTRIAATIFQALAVAAASAAAWRSSRSAVAAAMTGLCLVALQPLWHGRYEPGVAVVQVLVLTAMFEAPSSRTFFVGGLQVGLAGLIGRNVALYGLVGLALAMVVLSRDKQNPITRRQLAWAAAGCLAGGGPLVGMLLTNPGLSEAYWTSVRFHLEQRATNIPLPIPWPWAISFAEQPTSRVIAVAWHSLLFLLMPLLGVGVLAVGLWKGPALYRRYPIFTGAGMLSLAYMHYAFSRADSEHLQRAGAPLVMALTLMPTGRTWTWRWVPGAVVMLALLWMHPVKVYGTFLAGDASPLTLESWLGDRRDCLDAQIGHDHLCVQPYVAMFLDGVREAVQTFVRDGESVYVAPFDPGVYPALGLRAPTWELFPVLPVKAAFEQQEIARLEASRTRLAIVSREALDGRLELRFGATHPLLTRYLFSRFVVVDGVNLPPQFGTFVRP